MLDLKKFMTKCKICRQPFLRRNISHKVCSPDCAIIFAQQEKEKNLLKKARIERKKDKEKKIALKTRSDWVKDAQVAFNSWVRARDAGKPCICCGLDLGFYEVGGAFDAGHYRSVGSAPHLRFNEDNVHGQRKQCNRYGAGRAIDYRIGLIKRIGVERVEALESNNDSFKPTIEDLKEIIKKYKEKKNELLKSQ